MARIDDTNRLSAGTRGGWSWGGGGRSGSRVCRGCTRVYDTRTYARECTCVKLHVAGWVSPIFMGNISDSAAAIETLTSSTCPQ